MEVFTFNVNLFFMFKVSQQMAGMTFFGVGGMAGYGQPTTNQGPNPTLSSPMWK